MNPLIIGAILVIALIVVVLLITLTKKGKDQLGASDSPKKDSLPPKDKFAPKSSEPPTDKGKSETASKAQATDAEGEPPSQESRDEEAPPQPTDEFEEKDNSTKFEFSEEDSETSAGVKLDEKAEDKAVAELERERRERKLKKLRQGLAPTRSGLFAKIGDLFKSKKILDPSLLENLEDMLLVSDVGAKTAETLLSSIRSALDKEELSDPSAAWSLLKDAVREILTIDVPPIDVSAAKPFVIMVVGVNGVGKTTTIGKLATTYSENGLKVVLAAGDTFRAAAVNQLSIWGRRANAEVVKSKEGADPSSVVFDAIKKAKDIGADVVIADTAGRLHTQQPLMEELKKIHRVVGKAEDGAPHEVLLVLDATTGQNAIQQVSMFKETLDVTGLVLTKLDGTAKGGVIIGICHEHSIPVRYIGIGEARDDLREFEVADFVEALFFKEAK